MNSIELRSEHEIRDVDDFRIVDYFSSDIWNINIAFPSHTDIQIEKTPDSISLLCLTQFEVSYAISSRYSS